MYGRKPPLQRARRVRRWCVGYYILYSGHHEQHKLQACYATATGPTLWLDYVHTQQNKSPQYACRFLGRCSENSKLIYIASFGAGRGNKDKRESGVNTAPRPTKKTKPQKDAPMKSSSGFVPQSCARLLFHGIASRHAILRQLIRAPAR